MKKTIAKILSLLLVLVVLTATFSGCNSNKGDNGPVSSADSKSAETSDSDDKNPKDSGDSVVIYTNSGSNGRAEWITEYAKENGFNVTIVHIQGGDLANRIISEKNNQTADMVFGLNAMEYERLKREDVLESYKPAWADEVDMAMGDSEGFYYPIVVQPLFMTYNTDVYTSETAPKSYPELAESDEFIDKYTIMKLGGGTAKSVLSSILVQYTDESGTHGISDEGWNIMENFIGNGYIEPEDYDYWQDMIDGTRPICMIYGSGFLQKNESYESTNTDFMVPETGVPFVVEQTALFKNAKHPEEAKAFIDWFGTAEVQAAWSKEFGTIPAHPDAMDSASDDVKSMMDKVTQQPIDWKFVSENIEKWMEKIELEFVG